MQARHSGGRYQEGREAESGDAMIAITTLLILTTYAAAPTTAGAAPTTAVAADITVLLRSSFEKNEDLNFDQWPDEWTREKKRGYPQYLKIECSEEPSHDGERCLRMQLDGGAAAIYSPPIRTDDTHTYAAQCWVKTEQLVNDEASVGVLFLDDQLKVVESYLSEGIVSQKSWRLVEVGPVESKKKEVRYASIALILKPRPNRIRSRADLQGAALFDGLIFRHVPRLEVSLRPEGSLLTLDQPLSLFCALSGNDLKSPRIDVDLQDVNGQTLHKESVEMKIEEERQSQEDVERKNPIYQAVVDWPLPVRQPGYYRIVVDVSSEGSGAQRRSLRFAVVRSRAPNNNSEFGWTLADGENRLDLKLLARRLAESGVGWVKFPLWYEESDTKRVDQLVELIDELQRHGINLVGMLHDPPPAVREQLALPDNVPAADLFARDPNVWYPLIEPVIARLSLQVRWWQLSRDDDLSFMGQANPAERVRRVKQYLDRIGQDVYVGQSWSWFDEIQDTPAPPWRFVSRWTVPTLLPHELTAYLSHARAESPQLAQWVTIAALDSAKATLENRISDLVHQMLAAKSGGAAGIYYSEPFHPDHGLLTADGAPTELYLPWRTTSLLLGGTTYAGSFTLPHGSRAMVFRRAAEAVMIVWSDLPVDETIILGNESRHLDVWGRDLPLSRDGAEGTILASSTPTFVTGLPAAVMQCIMSFDIVNRELPSLYGVPLRNAVRMQNAFDGGMRGHVKMILPTGWRSNPEEFELHANPGDTVQQQFDLTLPPDVSSGPAKIAFQIELLGDGQHTVQLEREVTVGLNDVELEVQAALNSRGELEVEQRLINRTNAPVNYRCQLVIPGRRRIKYQVLSLDNGEDVRTFRIKRGKELVGKTLNVNAEEVDGTRVLNRHVRVTNEAQSNNE